MLPSNCPLNSTKVTFCQIKSTARILSYSHYMPPFFPPLGPKSHPCHGSLKPPITWLPWDESKSPRLKNSLLQSSISLWCTTHPPNPKILSSYSKHLRGSALQHLHPSQYFALQYFPGPWFHPSLK